MRCETTQDNLTALYDRELGALQTWRVRRHLAGCATCRTQFTSLASLDSLLKSWDLVTSPVAVSHPEVRPRVTIHRLGWQLAVVSGLLFVFVGWLWMYRATRRPNVTVTRRGGEHMRPAAPGTVVSPLPTPRFGSADDQSRRARGGAGAVPFMPSHLKDPPVAPLRAVDDMVYVNLESVATLMSWSASPEPSDTASVQAEVDRTLKKGDEFVHVPFPRIASSEPSFVSAASALYRQEREVVDARLSRRVSLALKGTAFADLCRILTEKTGITFKAARSVQDEKATLFCKEQPLRDLMRAINQVFAYRWTRTGQEGNYEYELAQDLRSQLAEEEMRSRDLHAALAEMDDRLTNSANPQGPEALASELYRSLSPAELAALRSGRELKFSNFDDGSSRRLPEGAERRLPRTGPPPFAPGAPPSDGSKEGTTVALRLDPSELGQMALNIEFGFFKLGPDGRPGAGHRMRAIAAVGRNPSASSLGNAKENGALRDQPLFKREVSLRPKPSCPKWTSKPAGAAAADQAPTSGPTANAAMQKKMRRTMRLGRRMTPGEPDAPHVNTADVWEEVHTVTGLTIVADYYTRLYPQKEVTVEKASLFDALCRVGDTLGVRWKMQNGALQCRSAAFFWDKQKEVPNRLLDRWQQDKRMEGGLPWSDLMEMASLSDQQIGSEIVGEGVDHCWGLEEWDLLVSTFGFGTARPWVRLVAGLPPGQRKEALSNEGLAISSLAPAQQQEASAIFAQILPNFGQNPPDTQTLFSSRIRIDYVPATRYIWVREIDPGGIVDVRRQRIISGRTAEDALAAARRVKPDVTASQIHRLDGALAVSLLMPKGGDAILAGDPLIRVNVKY
jgi:hypothetical protein